MPRYRVHRPIDPAVAVGLLPPELPCIARWSEFGFSQPQRPPELIEGILHEGCKLILGGTSKSNKTWCLLDMAISVAAGGTWWGRPCSRTKVLYINFELNDWAIWDRLHAIQAARPELKDFARNLFIWNLRGHAADLTTLRPKLMREILRHDVGLVIFDPAYKLLGERDENSNGEIAALMNEFEAMCYRTCAAIVLAHHFAKGDSTLKDPIDRMCGAGAWARDPDSLLILTPHEEEDCFTVSSILRNMTRLPEFVIQWEYPVMRAAPELNPDALRTPQAHRKVMTDHDFLEAFLSASPKSRKTILEETAEKGISRATTDRYLKRLVDAGITACNSGLYWVPTTPCSQALTSL